MSYPLHHVCPICIKLHGHQTLKPYFVSFSPRLADVADRISRHGYCSPAAFQSLRHLTVQDIVVGPNHIALLLEVRQHFKIIPFPVDRLGEINLQTYPAAFFLLSLFSLEKNFYFNVGIKGAVPMTPSSYIRVVLFCLRKKHILRE